MKKKICAVSALLFLIMPQKLFADDPTVDDVLNRDLSEMTEWLEGGYDNIEQVYFEELLALPEEQRRQRLHVIFARMEMSALGRDVFFVEQYVDNDPAKVRSRLVYSFTPDFAGQRIKMTIFGLKDDTSGNTEKISTLSIDDLTPMPEGCEVYWRRQASQFVGALEHDTCRIVSQRSGETMIINNSMVVSATEFWIDDSVRREGGEVRQAPVQAPFKLHKEAIFTCWVGVSNDQAEGGADYIPAVKISDQGGEIRITTTGDDPRTVGLKMRNVVWPYGTARDSLVLYAHKDMEGKATSYTWTAPDGKRIALNLRWIQASCTKDG